ncbi:hypothetical protein KCU88_g1632, partial [Aureobasidium melanogenum]
MYSQTYLYGDIESSMTIGGFLRVVEHKKVITMPVEVAIIGAGVGGLTLAVALRNNPNLNVNVYERATELKEIGAVVGLAPNGLRTLEKLGVHEVLTDEVGWRNRNRIPMIFKHWKTGEVLSQDYNHNVPEWRHQFARMHRAELQKALLAHVSPASIHVGKKAVQVEADRLKGVTALFADGTSIHVDILIGADGIKSNIRGNFVPNHELVWNGDIVLRSAFDYDLVKDLDVPQDSSHFTGPTGFFFGTRIGSEQFAVTAAFMVDPGTDPEFSQPVWNGPADVGILKERFKDWHPVIPKIIDRVPWVRRYANVAGSALDQWSFQDRVTLLGDAAHTHGGAFAAGASLAIDDAYTLQWVLPTFAAGFIEAKSSLPGGYVFTKAEKDKFASNPRAYLEFRRSIEKRLHPGNKGGVAGSPENESIKERCIESMRERLGGDEEWLCRLLPNYAPGCKRTTPAPGYLEALLTSQVTYVDTPISHATSTGLVDHQGTERHVDAIILATGFENGFRPLFPTIGRNGVDLNRQWAPDGPIGYPETYFGVMAPEMPNYFAVLQAQSYAVGGTVPLHCEISATYIAKVIRKVQSQGYKSVAPSQEATADFNEYVDQYFADKVTSDSCNSWLKNGTGKSRTLFGWPGTGHHRINILKEPRWEDFVFQRSETGRRNRYHYFGNGSTEEDEAKDLDALTGYLEEVGKVDLARLHER